MQGQRALRANKPLHGPRGTKLPTLSAIKETKGKGRASFLQGKMSYERSIEEVAQLPSLIA